MIVRRNVIESAVRKQSARWAIMTLRRWFVDWNKANEGKTHLEQSERQITRFIGHEWWKGDSLPSSLNWHRDFLTLDELLCVMIKTLYLQEQQQSSDDGGLLLWLLEGIIKAAQKWNLASGNIVLLEAIDMANWMEDFFQENSGHHFLNIVYEFRMGLLEAFARCDPDLTHPPTLVAYTKCLDGMGDLLKLINSSSLRETIVKQLTEVDQVLNNALRRIQALHPPQLFNPTETRLLQLCQYWLQKFSPRQQFKPFSTVQTISNEKCRIPRHSAPR